MWLIFSSFWFIRQSTKQLRKNHWQCQSHWHWSFYIFMCYNVHIIQQLFRQPTPGWSSGLRKGRSKRYIQDYCSSVTWELLEELEWFLRHPQLQREDCPNPIPWWGASILVCCSSIALISFNSFNLNTQFCKGYCGRAGRRAELGTSRGSKGL